MSVEKALKHLRWLRKAFVTKRDVFDNEPAADVVIAGKRIRDMNRDLWTDFIEELDAALVILDPPKIVNTELIA